MLLCMEIRSMAPGLLQGNSALHMCSRTMHLLSLYGMLMDPPAPYALHFQR
jgi:hypothetical protein